MSFLLKHLWKSFALAFIHCNKIQLLSFWTSTSVSLIYFSLHFAQVLHVPADCVQRHTQGKIGWRPCWYKLYNISAGTWSAINIKIIYFKFNVHLYRIQLNLSHLHLFIKLLKYIQKSQFIYFSFTLNTSTVTELRKYISHSHGYSLHCN